MNTKKQSFIQGYTSGCMQLCIRVNIFVNKMHTKSKHVYKLHTLVVYYNIL